MHLKSTASPIQLQSSFFTCADGTQIRYHTRTIEGHRPKIALVHSLAMDASFWDPVADFLALTMDVLTYDCRGHGQSDKPVGPYTNSLFVNDLLQLINHLDWPIITVAGASMGGTIALGLAIHHPERVEGIGLIDTTAWYGADAPKNWSDRAHKVQENGMQALIDFQKTRWFSEAFSNQYPDILERCIEVFLKNDITAFVTTCQMMGHFDLRDRLSDVKTKAIIIVGEEDYATPLAMSQAMHQNIIGSQLVILAHARHLTPLEQPKKIAELLANL